MFCLLIAASVVWALFTVPPSGAREHKAYERRRAEMGLPKYPTAAEYFRSDDGDVNHVIGWNWGDLGDGGGDDGGGGE